MTNRFRTARDTATVQARLRWAALGVALFAGLTVQAEARDLKLSLYISDTHYLTQNVFRPFAEEVSDLSEGSLSVQLFPSSVLGDATQQLELVETGIADMALIVPVHSKGRFPLTEAAMLPFAFDSAVEGTKVLSALRTDYLDAEYNTVKLLFIVETAPAAILSNEPIASLDDFEGKTIRGAGGAQTTVLEALGANVVNMPTSDIYIALERGTVDGATLPLSSVSGHKLEEVIKYINQLNFSATPIVLAINLGTWQSLTPDEQEAITTASEHAAVTAAGGYDSQEVGALEMMKARGIEVVNLSPEDQESVRAIAAPAWDTWAAAAQRRIDTAPQFLNAMKDATAAARQ